MPMKPAEQKKAAKKFAEYWADKGYEKGESQPFWLSLLRDVFGVEHPEQFIRFEDKVMLDNASFIDGFIPSSRVMIEQKSRDRNLRKGIRQSDGSFLTPFQQAKRYITEMNVDLHPYYVITCNFQTFLIYDMHNPQGEPAEIRLADLEKEYDRLSFIVKTNARLRDPEVQVSIDAGEIVGRLYDALEAQYAAALNGGDAENLSAQVRNDLNKLCVRLVFCFYAEDAGVFGSKNMFHDYLAGFRAEYARDALIKLFAVLDTPESQRDPLDVSPAAAFPYVNGGLFSGCTSREVPPLSGEILRLILDDCCAHFDWSRISPTIFGAVFESTLNQETRRAGGMHYTSIENIHKVIDPLFLDGLKREYDEICEIKLRKNRRAALAKFQDKLASLRFFDPAAGSGNFLTETFLCLRKIENDLLRRLVTDDEGEGLLLAEIKVNIGQFYGIEINDFAVSVAKTALWIAESQMMNVTESIIGATRDFLPLTTNANIVEGNALRLDWKEIVPPEKLNYIMGNPPFVGYSLQSEEQKKDMLRIYADENGKPYKTAGKIDYVAAWYFKAAQFMQGTDIRAALVSTNSITQGEQVAAVWRPLYERFGIHIDFAWRTFRWDNEAKDGMAHVHCVIVGFSSAANTAPKKLFDGAQVTATEQINPYLLAGSPVFVEARNKPLCAVPEMLKGSSPVDGKNNLLLSDEECQRLLHDEPQSSDFIRRFYGAREFLHNEIRWCLWLLNATPAQIKNMPLVKDRVAAVKEFRMASPKAATRKFADLPGRFMEVRQPDSDYILIPRHSSENRKYIPFGFMTKDAICGDANSLIPNATLFHFGILTSNVHMAWVRAVCGRIKSDYRYSNDIVYNNFPWPSPTPEQRSRIETTAQAILDARAKYPDSSLADLYDDLTMPPELRKAHQENDKAVMTAYGFDWRTMTESDCVAELFRRYEKIAAASGQK